MTRRLLLSLFSLALALPAQPVPAVKLTSPKEQFGFNIGDDYHLANYKQLTTYWQKLEKESRRFKLVDIGKTEEGRTQYMAIITSPENHRKLDRLKEISRRLAKAEGLTDDQARALAQEGKAVVWIDGGLHATEVLGSQQLIETSWQLVSRNDPETLRFLNDCIILLVHANPDGMDLVSDWYMREKDPARREYSLIPRLYQKYAGHDNNRDFYMGALKESQNMLRILFEEWFPQIMYNHHQSGPAGTIMFAPPFRDPFNYNFDPLVMTSLDLVGAAMHTRFAAENKPGVTTRKGATYSTWYNGGLRTTTYFHNMVGLLTETVGNPTPMDIPFRPERMLPSTDYFLPLMPTKLHFRTPIDYSVTANRAVIDVASKNREDFLFNIYQMGRNSIQRGSRDTWSPSPKRVAAVQEAVAKERGAQAGDGTPTFMQRGMASLRGGAPLKFFDMLRKPEDRDPRGYILPSDQPDLGTAVKFLNTLVRNGVTIHRATAAFTVNGKSYPAGSYIVKTAQAFRPHIIDMFEPQDHPNDFLYAGGPPIPPYDSAGWTLAYQMGVKFDRVLDAFDGPFEKTSGLLKPPAGKVDSGATGWMLSHTANDSFIVVNRLLKAGAEVYRNAQGIYVPAAAPVKPILDKAAAEFGLSFTASTKPSGELLKLRPVKIGLWDRYGGSMPSGWVRLLLEQFEFNFEVVYPQAIDAGNLARKFDVLILVDGAYSPRATGFEIPEPNRERIPAEYHSHLGRLTAEKSAPKIKEWLTEGGVVLAIGSSTGLAQTLGLPLSSALVEKSPTGQDRPLSREKYYIPGSVLQAAVDPTHPLAWGFEKKVDVFFDNSPVFKLAPEAFTQGVRPVVWFAADQPLRSGWAWGQSYLKGGVTIAEAKVGEGKVCLLGPEVTFRAQPHGTFKFLFNGIVNTTAKRAN